MTAHPRTAPSAIVHEGDLHDARVLCGVYRLPGVLWSSVITHTTCPLCALVSDGQRKPGYSPRQAE